jgi:uncharacterized membrane protein YraQ (UPF0718 family)
VNKTSTNKQEQKPFKWRGTYLLLSVIVVYIVLLFIDSQTLFDALQKSGKVLAKILPIFVFVILFTATINYFLRPKQIARHLGHESGLKGWFWSLAGGVVSHGPMYAWFPLLEDLRRHGMRDALIVVFIYARAIKLPILPIMIDYFGWLFTLVLSLFILLGAILQGLTLEFFERRLSK